MLDKITRQSLAAGTAGLIGIAVALPVSAETPFYKGKQVTIMVGYSPGGGSDLTGRLVSRHLGKHVAGNPQFIVKNMAGAGGTIAVNYVGEAAAPDGKTALWGTFPLQAQLLGDEALKVDLRKFEYIAGTPGNQVLYTRTDVNPGVKQPIDIFKAEGIVLAGLRVSSNKDLAERLALNILGIEYKYVTGFKGNSRARAAVQQGLANSYLEGLPSYLGVAVPTMVKTGMVTPIYQLGAPSESGDSMVRDPEAADVPTMEELYEMKHGKKPSGVAYRAYVALTAPYSVSQRVLALAPGSPNEAVKALREGAVKMEKDPEFQADMMKVIKYKLPVYRGEQAEKAIEAALSASDEVKKYLEDHLEAGNRLSRK